MIADFEPAQFQAQVDPTQRMQVQCRVLALPFDKAFGSIHEPDSGGVWSQREQNQIGIEWECAMLHGCDHFLQTVVLNRKINKFIA